MTRRADHVDDTRQRIIEATVALHGSVGPAATTVMAIAERAGVTRATVYRHFADDAALFQACSSHWLSQQSRPNTARWADIAGPEERLRAGLADLYRFYRAGESMLTRIYRDIAALPEQHRHGIQQRDAGLRDLLLAAFAPSDRRRPTLRAVVGHAVSFSTWRSLCIEQRLSNAAAIDVLVRLVIATIGRD